MVERPSATSDVTQVQSLSEDLFVEVVVSKLPVAIYRDVQKAAVVALEESTARYFTGPYFHCPKGRHPFLLRPVYGYGGTGGFVVSQIKKSVLVAHNSLGHSTVYNKSALVACLRDSPAVVYTAISVAE